MGVAKFKLGVNEIDGFLKKSYPNKSFCSISFFDSEPSNPKVSNSYVSELVTSDEDSVFVIVFKFNILFFSFMNLAEDIPLLLAINSNCSKL